MKQVSIITATYNRETLLPRMIQSVMAQKFPNWELIIIDDGSSDKTREVIESYNNSRIKYYFKNNSGAAHSRNVGVNYAKSEYIIFLDSDDEAKPDWLEKLYFPLSESKYSVVCCGLEKFNHCNELIAVELPEKLDKMFFGIVAKFLSGTMLMPKQLFLDCGGFDVSLPSMQHTEFFIRFSRLLQQKRIQIVNIYEPLLKVYIHKGDRIRYDLDAIYRGNIITLKKHKEMFLEDKKMHFDYLSVVGVSAIKTNRLKEGKKYLLQAMKVDPYNYLSYLRIFVVFTPPLRRFFWKN